MPTYLIAIVCLVVAAGCTQKTEAPPPGHVAAPTAAAATARISGTEAKRLVAAGAQLVDVRSPEEFAEEHIPGAQNIPVNELDGKLASLSKDKPVVVYCQAGGRATVAAQHLSAAGFQVHNLGGIAAWDK